MRPDERGDRMSPGDLIILPGDVLAVFIERRGRSHSLILREGQAICVNNEWFRCLDEVR